MLQETAISKKGQIAKQVSGCDLSFTNYITHKFTDVKNEKIILVVLLFLSLASATYSRDVDSLYTLFSEAKSIEKIRLANEICAYAYEREVVKEEWVFTSDSKDSFVHSQVLFCMSGFKAANADYGKATEYAEEGLAIDLSGNDLAMVSRDYLHLATIYDRLNLFDKALSCFEKSLEVARQMGDKEREARTLLNMGIFNLRKNRNSVGVQFVEEALKIAVQKDLKKILATGYGTIGEYYLKHENTDKAMDAISKSLEACREIGTPFYLEAGLCRLGLAQMATGEYEKAEKNLLEALEMSKLLESKIQTAFNLMALGDLKIKQNLTEKADYYFNQSVQKSIELEDYNLLSVIYDKLYQLHRDNNPALSLKYLEEGILVDDSLYNLEMHDQISTFQVKYDTQQKELEIVRQQAEISRHESNRTLLIIGLILSVLTLILLIVTLRMRTKRNRILAEMNTTKDKFFSIISHDLKNPAIAQRDALQLLLSHSNEWDTKSLSQYYSELLKSADGQVELLYNLLNWAQVQTGRMPYVPIQFDIVSALRPDILLLENMSKHKGVSLKIQQPETAVVTGDCNMITTVVRNLLTNAIKFTPTGGSVSLAIEHLPHDGQTTISVSDTGVGMSNEQLQNLFHIENRNSRRGTAGESGSGLGLIVCKELIEKHGSTLHIESEEQKGSRFYFSL